jgi:hypothetical protein
MWHGACASLDMRLAAHKQQACPLRMNEPPDHLCTCVLLQCCHPGPAPAPQGSIPKDPGHLRKVAWSAQYLVPKDVRAGGLCPGTAVPSFWAHCPAHAPAQKVRELDFIHSLDLHVAYSDSPCMKEEAWMTQVGVDGPYAGSWEPSEHWLPRANYHTAQMHTPVYITNSGPFGNTDK